MATSNIPDQIENWRTVLLGPAANNNFNSLKEQSIYFLDTYWPNWRNYASPISYIIPLVYSYIHPEITKEGIDKATGDKKLLDDNKVKLTKDNSEAFNVIRDWTADESEHIVYNAIYRIIQEDIQLVHNGGQPRFAPFIAVRSLDLAKHKHHMKKLFPGLQFNHLRQTLEKNFCGQLADIFSKSEEDLRKCLEGIFLDQLSQLISDFKKGDNWRKSLNDLFLDRLGSQKMPEKLKQLLDKSKRTFDQYFREHDFILIGPKIGIIVIEVKSQPFTNKKDFVDGKPFLPDDYSKGIDQAESIEVTFGFLQECVGVEIPEKSHVRKILSTPNLKKARYDDWMKSLADNGEGIKGKIGDRVQQWFNEHMENNSTPLGEPALYTALKEELGKGQPISTDIFEAYASIIAALNSITLLKSTDTSCDIQWDQFNFSTNDLMLYLTAQIEGHSPAKKPRLDYSEKYSSLKKDSKELAKVILLTSEKQQALGESRQTKTIFHSPEQQTALSGPNRQFIVGAAGTGKTIVLQAKAVQVLSEGKSVIVLTSEYYMDRYEKLFENQGFHMHEPGTPGYEISNWIYTAVQGVT